MCICSILSSNKQNLWDKHRIRECLSLSCVLVILVVTSNVWSFLLQNRVFCMEHFFHYFCSRWKLKCVDFTGQCQCRNRLRTQNFLIWKMPGPEVKQGFNLLKPNDIYMSYRSANLQTLHFKYLFNKYTYW